MLTSHIEVARLPGCGAKIAELWHEWKETGRLPEADEAQSDTKFAVIQTFYDIWGVGDATARDFYSRGLCYCLSGPERAVDQQLQGGETWTMLSNMAGQV